MDDRWEELFESATDQARRKAVNKKTNSTTHGNSPKEVQKKGARRVNSLTEVSLGEEVWR